MQAINYLPIPFVPHGRSKEGVDCWGLVCLIYADHFGIQLPSYSEVDWKDGEAVARSVKEQQQAEWAEVDAKDRREFDVILLRIKGLPWHVGVVLNQRQFIHIDPSRGVCVESFNSIHWKNRILGYFRHTILL
jgi:cell wall-associated NlpC family hydrolase